MLFSWKIINVVLCKEEKKRTAQRENRGSKPYVIPRYHKITKTRILQDTGEGPSYSREKEKLSVIKNAQAVAAKVTLYTQKETASFSKASQEVYC